MIDLSTAFLDRTFARDAASSASLETTRVVIAGNQLISRAGLHVLLTRIQGVHIVGEAEDGAAGLHVAASRCADVLVVDMPPVRDHDLNFLRRTAVESMQIRVLLLLSPFLAKEALAAIRLGAHGVLSKDAASSQDLCEALRAVSAGRYWLGDCHGSSLTEALELLSDGDDSEANPHRFGLTRRELQVVPLMVQGYSNREIAGTLSISIQTVKHHCSHIYDKIGASNRLELALFAIQHRLVHQPVPAMTSHRLKAMT